MNLVRSIRSHPQVVALMVLATVLRFYGLRWGLPEVFEEATPMREAWQMWGWGAGSFDPNPHFFNYPSLVIYLQLAGQAVLLAAMKLVGAVDSTVDFRALYATDKTLFVTTGRTITALFGVATVGALYALVRRVAGHWPALVAALLLAVNTLHISKSQAIEVDVPLTFFVVLSLWATLLLIDAPSRRRYVTAGVLVGLAASSKYTGAGLILPLVVAHLLARRKQSPPAWSLLVIALAGAAAAFVLTSPYVLLDMGTFLQHISVERYHMRSGHFGLESGASWGGYLKWLAGGAMGLPTLLLGVAGLVVTLVRRREWAMVVAAFLVPYVLALGSWSMRAERYLIPAIPAMLLFAMALLALVKSHGARGRTVTIAVVVILMLFPLAYGFPAHLDRLGPDSRSLAREWVERNVVPGSFIVTESYGPQLYGPYLIWQLEDDVRQRVFKANAARPYYAIQELPMYQVDPERSGVFYDHDVLAVADVIVTTAAVRSRYEKEPARFSRQVAFYRNLESSFELVAEFDGIRIYRNRGHARPFSGSGSPAPPPPLQEGLVAAPGAQEQFYFYLGMNFEAFNHYAAAYTCYETAFRYAIPNPVLLTDVAIGMARCLGATGRGEMAIQLLTRVESAAPGAADRERLRRFRGVLSRSSTNP